MAFPESRPVLYDETALWDEDAGTWTGIDVGGSIYKNHLVIIGQDSTGQGLVYYGEI